MPGRRLATSEAEHSDSRQAPVAQLGIFARHWTPGQAKTRLAAALGVDGAKRAAQLQRIFLATLLQRFAEPRRRCTLAYCPDEAQADFADLCAGLPWQLQPQGPGHLGERMHRYFHSARQAGFQTSVLIGSDSPNVPRDYIEQAFERLRRHPVVLGPSDDGGYYLIGASVPLPKAAFEEIAWSTPKVWEQTLARLRAVDLQPAELPRWYDVDEVADLQRLDRDLASATGISGCDQGTAWEQRDAATIGETAPTEAWGALRTAVAAALTAAGISPAEPV